VRVTFEELDDVPVEKMLVAECEDHHVGECIGYRCQECHEADETLDQIFHDEDCELAGEHGRQHYDDLEGDLEAGPPPEFDRDHPVWIVEAAETDPADEVYNGTVVAFKCRCGNSDDDLFEIVHDEGCPLADPECEIGTTDSGALQQIPAMADGTLN
jgi:hypothetical protein